MNLFARGMVLVAVACSIGACAPSEEEVPVAVEKTSSALSQYVTRDVCKACGCVASDFVCACRGLSGPSPKQQECLDNGGPVKTLTGAQATVSTDLDPADGYTLKP